MPDANTVQHRQRAVLLGLIALPFLVLVLYLLPIPIRGLVLDAQDGQHLAGVAVQLDGGLVVTSDEQGRFVARAGRLGSLSATIDLDGYQYWQESARFPLLPLLAGNLDAPLQPTRLQGQLTDASSDQPVAGAQVLAGGQSVISDAGGAFRLLRLPAGPTSLQVEAAGFIGYEQVTEVSRSETEVESLDVRLLPNGLRGAVRDGLTGQPLAGVSLRFGERTGESAQDGSFYLSHVTGPDTLAGTLPGYRPLEQAVESAAMLRGEELLDVVMEPTVLAGQVIDERSGEPLAGVRLTAGADTAVSDAGGRYRFERLHGQDLTLNAQMNGYLAIDLAVDEAETLLNGRPLDLALAPKHLAGRVLNLVADSPLAGATAIAGDKTAATDDTGRFVLWGAEPPATVFVSADGFFDEEVQYSDDSQRTISLRPRHAVVKVSDLVDGEPLADISLTGPRSEAVTDAQGVALLRLLDPGEVFTATAPGYASANVTYDGADQVQLQLYRDTVAGQVVDADSGQGVPGALIYIYDSESCQGATCRGTAPLQMLQAEEDGDFLVDGLPPQPQFMIKAPGYRLLYPEATPSGTCSTPLCLPAALVPFDARGFYIPFHVLYNRGLVEERLDLVANSSVLNAVVVDIKSDFGELAWEPRYPIARELGVYQPDIMDVPSFLALAQERDIYTIARFVTFKDDPLAKGHPEWAVRKASDPSRIWLDGENLAWVDPYRQEVWEYEIELAKELAELGFDEIQFDYFRFSGHPDHSLYLYAQPSTPETRRAAISGFARELMAALKPYGVFTSVDVFGYTIWAGMENEANIGQTLADIAPLLDYLSPMIYPQTFGAGSLGAYPEPVFYPYEVIYDSITLNRDKISAPTRIRPWLQGYPNNYRFSGPAAGYNYGIPEMMIQRQAAEDAGSSGWLFWSGGGNFPWEIFGPMPSLSQLRAQVAQRQGAGQVQEPGAGSGG